MLRGLVARDGGLLETHRRLGDDPDEIRAALLAPGAEIILVSGGSSVGSEDYAPRLIAEIGELAIHGVAMRPSSPAGVGRIGARSCSCCQATRCPCLCAYDFFAGRAIRPAGWPSTRLAAPNRFAASWVERSSPPLAASIIAGPHRRRFGRAHRAERSLDALVDYARRRLRDRSPQESEGYGPDSEVTVYLYDD
jgi:molybdopterin molybdotransferase